MLQDSDRPEVRVVSPNPEIDPHEKTSSYFAARPRRESGPPPYPSVQFAESGTWRETSNARFRSRNPGFSRTCRIAALAFRFEEKTAMILRLSCPSGYLNTCVARK